MIVNNRRKLQNIKQIGIDDKYLYEYIPIKNQKSNEIHIKINDNLKKSFSFFKSDGILIFLKNPLNFQNQL